MLSEKFVKPNMGPTPSGPVKSCRASLSIQKGYTETLMRGEMSPGQKQRSEFESYLIFVNISNRSIKMTMMYDDQYRE